jgi:hypothetical protein
METPDHVPVDMVHEESWRMIEEGWRQIAEDLVRAAHDLPEDELRRFVRLKAVDILDTCDQLKENRELHHHELDMIDSDTEDDPPQ